VSNKFISADMSGMGEYILGSKSFTCQCARYCLSSRPSRCEYVVVVDCCVHFTIYSGERTTSKGRICERANHCTNYV